MIDELLATLDRGDTNGYAAFFAPDASFTFGNLEPVQGREAIAASCASFLGLISSLRHRVIQRWTIDDVTILRTVVDYVTHDQRTVSVPLAIVLTQRAGLINDYTIYGDVAPVFTAPA